MKAFVIFQIQLGLASLLILGLLVLLGVSTLYAAVAAFAVFDLATIVFLGRSEDRDGRQSVRRRRLKPVKVEPAQVFLN